MEEVKFYPPPSAPYFFENSKCFQGKSLEYVLFNNSSAFFRISRRAHHEGDRMHRHIKFLLTAGDDLETRLICPFCKKESIKFFLLLDNHFVHQKLTCCANEACRKALKAGHGDDMLIALKVINLGMKVLKTKTLRKKVEMIFRQALGLKPTSKPQAIFDAVSAKYLRYFDVSSEQACQEPEEPQKEPGETLKTQAPIMRRKKKKRCLEKQLSLNF